MIACGLPHIGRGDFDVAGAELAAIQPQVAGLRRFGAAALDLAWVAAGRFDGYWERNLSSWDMAAGIVLVREAGGFVSDIDRRRQDFRDARHRCRQRLHPPRTGEDSEADRQVTRLRAIRAQFALRTLSSGTVPETNSASASTTNIACSEPK